MGVFNRLIFRMLDSQAIFFFELASIFLLIILNINNPLNEWGLIFQHLIIGGLSVSLIISRKSGFLTQSMGVFSLIAFSLFPILEMSNNIIYWKGAAFEYPYYIKANISIIVFLIVYKFSYRHHLNLQWAYDFLRFPKILNFKQSFFCLILSACLLIFKIHLFSWDIISILLRGGKGVVGHQLQTQSVALIIEYFLRPLIFNLGLILFYFSSRNYIFLFFGLGVALFAAFPTSIPRFFALTLYIPLLLAWGCYSADFPKKSFKMPRFIFPNLLIFGLFFIFPFLNIFRNYSPESLQQYTLFSIDGLLSGHMDSYQMFMRAIEVGEITFGGGLLGVLFFFIPRATWPTKPISSPYIVSNLADLSLDNVSMPLIAELYLNFWYFGIVLGAIFFGILLRSIDRVFLEKNEYKFSAEWIIYFQSSAILIFVLRGSLMAAFAYFMGLVSSWLVIRKFLQLTR